MSAASTQLPPAEGPGSVPGASHRVAEQAPEEMVAALTEFLAPYREDGGGLR